MINLKQFALLTTVCIFLGSHDSHAMVGLIVTDDKTIEAQQPAAQEIKQPLSLKESCFNGLFKDEESKEKIPTLLKRTKVPFELAQEFAPQVAAKTSFKTLASIAPELPVTVYPDIALELLCSRNEKKERKEILELLLHRSKGDNEVSSIIQPMYLLTDNLPDVDCPSPEAYKMGLFLVGMSLAYKGTSFLKFLLSKGIKPEENFLDLFFNMYELHGAKSIRSWLKQNTPELDNEFFQKRCADLSPEDAKICFAMHTSFEGMFENIKILLNFGLRPSPNEFDFFIVDENNHQGFEETLFNRIANELERLRGERGLNHEFALMVCDKLLGLKYNKSTSETIQKIRAFYQDKPENNSISYLKTELKDPLFAQKIPLFEKLVQEKIEFHQQLLLILLPYCKDDVEKHKDQLEAEFKMPLDELTKWCEEQKNKNYSQKEENS